MNTKLDIKGHEYQIESGIPIPPENSSFGSGSTGLVKALKLMKIGDSMLLPAAQGKSVRSCRTGFKFTTRIVGNYVRIWRIE